MFGVIEFKNGEFEYMECDGKFNGESYIVFLKKLLDEAAMRQKKHSISDTLQRYSTSSTLFGVYHGTDRTSPF